jgi:hypothetical protein
MTHPSVVMRLPTTLTLTVQRSLRCGSKTLPVQCEAPDGLTSKISLSPSFSCFMPRLTQVLTPQTDLPHGSTRICVLPSPRAQSPRYDGPPAEPRFRPQVSAKPLPVA